MNQELGSFISQYDPPIKSLILETRELILQALPGAIEQVDLPSRIIAYGYGRKYADLICAIAPYAAHVNLMFSRGTELDDPEGLLEGTGKHARHVKLRGVEDVRCPGLQALLDAANEKQSQG